VSTPFRAGKPTLTSHPVIGGDALRFPIAPTPPGLWWIALRGHITANPALKRPWDEQSESALVVECPNLTDLDAVIHAVDDAIERSNRDYADQLTASAGEQERLDAETARRQRERESILSAIDQHYAADDR
jgi:hypothetical protein